MKFGVRECCDVVLRAKSAQKIGNKIFYKNEPVCYFDTLRTSTLEGAATTVYAQGGRGNARLMSWDGERTVTFTMEDALISPVGLTLLTGAGLIEANSNNKVIQHVAEQTDCIIESKKEIDSSEIKIPVAFVDNKPYTTKDPSVYVMILDDHGEVQSEPYLFTTIDVLDTDQVTAVTYADNSASTLANATVVKIKNTDIQLHGAKANETLYKVGTVYGPTLDPFSAYNGKYPIVYLDKTFKYEYDGKKQDYDVDLVDTYATGKTNRTLQLLLSSKEKAILVDYYTAHDEGAFEINITPDKFGGTFYLEASTLWRDQGTGKDCPAEFIIPSCKIQSNFSFTLSSSGDPSSFTFTMDAFPDYTRWNHTEKVLACIQVIGASTTSTKEVYRSETWARPAYEPGSDGIVTGAIGQNIGD